MNCSSCSHILPSEDSLFCPHCGEKLEKEDCCCVCGKPYLPNANFCDRCGSPVERAKAPDQQLFAEPLGEEEDHRGKVYHTREVALGIVYEDWALIHGGEFVMGSPVDELYRFDYERQHQVQVNSFELMKTPVTFAMYDAYCDVHDIVKPKDEGWGRGNRPVINISYWDAIDYCSWLRKVTGWMIRLTTEAEWEYACRAGTGTPFSTGETISSDQANFDGTFIYGKGEGGIKRGMTTPVGQFAPNPWGFTTCTVMSGSGVRRSMKMTITAWNNSVPVVLPITTIPGWCAAAPGTTFQAVCAPPRATSWLPTSTF